MVAFEHPGNLASRQHTVNPLRRRVEIPEQVGTQPALNSRDLNHVIRAEQLGSTIDLFQLSKNNNGTIDWVRTKSDLEANSRVESLLFANRIKNRIDA